MDFRAGKKFESYLIWYPKINSRCILDLNGEDKTIKFLVPNRKISTSPWGRQRFLSRTYKAPKHREKNNKPNSIEMKNLKDLCPE